MKKRSPFEKFKIVIPNGPGLLPQPGGSRLARALSKASDYEGWRRGADQLNRGRSTLERIGGAASRPPAFLAWVTEMSGFVAHGAGVSLLGGV